MTNYYRVTVDVEVEAADTQEAGNLIVDALMAAGYVPLLAHMRPADEADQQDLADEVRRIRDEALPECACPGGPYAPAAYLARCPRHSATARAIHNVELAGRMVSEARSRKNAERE